VAERAVTAGMPAGKLLVRGSFLIAKLAFARIALCQLLVVLMMLVVVWLSQWSFIKPKDALRSNA
jgi:hypothetical protein